MNFSYIDDPKWGTLDSDTKQQVIGLAFQKNVASDPKWNTLPDATKQQVMSDYTKAASDYSARASAHEERGLLGDITSNVARGFTDLGELTGHALKTLDPDGGINVGDKIGQKLIDTSEKARDWDIMRPDVSEVEGEGFIKRGVSGGFRSAVPSLATLGAGVASGAAVGSFFGPVGTFIGGLGGGTAATLGLFGLGTYGQKKEEYAKQGIDEETAHKAALKHSIVEAGIEEASNIMGLLTFGGAKLATQPLKQTARELLRTPVKTFAKNLTKNAALNEIPTEMLQGALGAKIDQNIGLLPDGAWQEAAVESIVPAMVMSVLFGVGAQGIVSAQRAQVKNQLNSEDPQKRIKAAQYIASNIKEPDLKKAWIGMVEPLIKEGKPIDINADFSAVAPRSGAEFSDGPDPKEQPDNPLADQNIQDIQNAKDPDEMINAFASGINAELDNITGESDQFGDFLEDHQRRNPQMTKREVPFNPPDLRPGYIPPGDPRKVQVKPIERPFNLPDATPKVRAKQEPILPEQPIVGESEGLTRVEPTEQERFEARKVSVPETQTSEDKWRKATGLPSKEEQAWENDIKNQQRKREIVNLRQRVAVLSGKKKKTKKDKALINKLSKRLKDMTSVKSTSDRQKINQEKINTSLSDIEKVEESTTMSEKPDLQADTEALEGKGTPTIQEGVNIEGEKVEIEPTALQGFPEMTETEKGGYALNNFANHEIESLRAAGAVYKNDQGVEVVDVQKLWEARKKFQSLPRKDQEKLLQKSNDKMFRQPQDSLKPQKQNISEPIPNVQKNKPEEPTVSSDSEIANGNDTNSEKIVSEPDIQTKKGKPFQNKGTAKLAIIRDKKQETHEPVEVDGGWVGRLITPTEGNKKSSEQDGGTKYQVAMENPTGWYSKMQSTLDQKLNNAPAQMVKAQVHSWAKKGMFKKEELEWSGLSEWLDSKKGKVSKSEVMEFLDENRVEVEDVVKGEDDKNFLIGQEIEALSDLNGWDFDDRGNEYGYVIDENNETVAEGYPEDMAAALDIDIDSLGDETSTKFSDYQLPGGENYKEILLTLPSNRVELTNELKEYRNLAGQINLGATPNDRWYELQEKYPNIDPNTLSDEGKDYKSQHWNEPNVLAHVRMSERTIDGKKVLHIEEIQSDWHQEGRKKGYGDNKYKKEDVSILEEDAFEASEPDLFWYFRVPENVLQIPKKRYKTRDEALKYVLEQKDTGERNVPDAPFKKSWPMLAFKRMVRIAAENDFDAIAWTQGNEQADRYDLSRQVDSIGVSIQDKETRTVSIETKSSGFIDLEINKDGRVSHSVQSEGDQFRDKTLDEVLGKETAEKIMSVEKNVTLEGQDLKVGGSGMKGFYDKILPSEVNKFFNKKKWGKAKVTQTNLDTATGKRQFGFDHRDAQLHMLPVTPQMKKKALVEGMPLFQTQSLNSPKESDNIEETPNKETKDVSNLDKERDASQRNPKGGGKTAEDRFFNLFGFRDPDGNTHLVPADTKELRQLKKIGSLFGKDIHFWTSQDEELDRYNGLTNPATSNEIYVNVNSLDPLISIVSHELVHQLRYNHPDLYEFLENTIRTSDEGFKEYVETFHEARKDSFSDIKEQDRLFEEFIGDFMSDQSHRVEFWSKLAQQNKSFTQKIIDILQSILDKINRIFPRAEQFVTNFKESQDALVSAMSEAINRESDLKSEVDGDTKYSVTSDKGKGDISTESNPGMPDGGNPFKDSVIQDVVYHGTTKKSSAKILKEGFKPRIAKAVWFAHDGGYATKYADSRSGDSDLLPVYLHMSNPLIIDMKGGENLPSGLEGTLGYANSLEDAVGVARQWGHDGVIFKNRKKTIEGFSSDEYAVFSNDQIKIASPNQSSTPETGVQSSTPADTSPRNTDTKAFRKWFKNSKVVDEDGEPLVVYHGTPYGNFADRADDINRYGKEAQDHNAAKDKKWMDDSGIISEMRLEESKKHGNLLYSPDYNSYISLSKEIQEARDSDRMEEVRKQPVGDVFRYIGTNDSGYLGAGFYFTGDRSYAKNWARSANRPKIPGEKKSPYIYETYLSIENPYYPDSTVKPDGFNKKLNINRERLKPLGGRRYDIDALQLAEAQAWSLTLQDFGFDGIIGESAAKDGVEYVVFKPTQIKSIYNKGTFDSQNPDIRYQTASGVEADYSETEDGYFQKAVDLVSGSVKYRKDKGKGSKDDISNLASVFKTTMYNASKIGGAAKRTFDIFRKQTDWKFDKTNELLFDGDHSLQKTIEGLRKTSKKEYTELNEYFVKKDRMALGHIVKETDDGFELFDYVRDARGKKKRLGTFESEDAAWEASREYEAEKSGLSERGQEALKAARLITRKLYKHYASDMMAAVESYKKANLPMPEITTVRNGKEVQIDLETLSKELGDRQGYYFPRLRQSGQYRVFGEKGGRKQHKYFDRKFLADGYRKGLERKGYITEFTHVGKLTEDIYQSLEPLLKLQQTINKTLSQMSNKDKQRVLEDKNIHTEWRGESLVLKGDGIDPVIEEMLKPLGGVYHDKFLNRSYKPEIIFENVEASKAEKLENDITKTVLYSGHTFKDMDVAFASAFAKQFDAVLKSRGSRSRMIGRGDSTGDAVSRGYEEDLLTALIQASNAAAGGYAKGRVAQEASAAIMGRDITWEDFKKEHDDGGIEDLQGQLEELRLETPADVEKKKIYQEKLRKLRGSLLNKKFASLDEVETTQNEIASIQKKIKKITQWSDADKAEKIQAKINVQRTGLYEKYQKMVKKRSIEADKQAGIYKDLTATLKDILKNDEATDRMIGTLKGLSVWQYLGFRVSSAAVNMTNMVTGVPAAINGETDNDVSIASALKHIGIGMKEYGLSRLNKSKYQELYDEIHKKGFDEPKLNREAFSVLQTKLGQGWSKALEVSMAMFGATERMNRAATIAGTYLAMKKKNKGEWDHGKMLLKAREISDFSHGVYEKSNRPYHMRGDNVGARALQLAYVFQTFQHNYIQEMLRLGFDKKQTKAALYMALSPAIFGLGSTIPMGIAKAISNAMGGDDPEEKLIQLAEDNFGMGNFARYGITGIGDHGISLKGSLATRFGTPQSFMDIFGAPGSVVGDMWEGGRNITKGYWQEGFEKIAPAAFGNISKGIRESTEGVTTKSGTPVFWGKEQLKGDSIDMVLRILSFNPTGISKKKEIQWNEYKIQSRYRKKKTELYKRLKRFYSKPPGERNAFDLMEIKADIRDFNQEVKEKKIHRFVPVITTRSIKASLRRIEKAPKRERLRKI